MASCSLDASSDTGPIVHSSCSPRRRLGWALQVGRAKRTTSAKSPRPAARERGEVSWRSLFQVRGWLHVVVDSGCTWHVHNVLEDLINVRACHDSVTDASGNSIDCPWIGDLPISVLDSRGREIRMLLRGVRYSSAFEDTLLSVDQLWYGAKIDCVFRNVRQLIFTQNEVPSSGGEVDHLRVPFQRTAGLYRMRVAILHADTPTAGAKGLKRDMHTANAFSHVSAMPADSAAAYLHRRLHVSLEHLRRLADSSADAPAHLRHATKLTCSQCAEANSTRLSHTASQYHPSHAGRLVHADIVGPFTR